MLKQKSTRSPELSLASGGSSKTTPLCRPQKQQAGKVRGPQANMLCGSARCLHRAAPAPLSPGGSLSLPPDHFQLVPGLSGLPQAVVALVYASSQMDWHMHQQHSIINFNHDNCKDYISKAVKKVHLLSMPVVKHIRQQRVSDDIESSSSSPCHVQTMISVFCSTPITDKQSIWHMRLVGLSIAVQFSSSRLQSVSYRQTRITLHQVRPMPHWFWKPIRWRRETASFRFASATWESWLRWQ